MTATVGIRSGLSRHWTGSLLELNCSSTESLSDYPDTVVNPSYVHWRANVKNGAENLHNLNGNGYVCLTHEDDSDEYVYSKDDMTRFDGRGNSGTSNLTSNQIFRLRQLISLLHRNFHHRYGKRPGEFSGKSSRNSFSSSDFNRSFGDAESAQTTNQYPMQSFGCSSVFNNDQKLIHALFDANLESCFPSESSFLLITKSKRRHCSSEGDLTFASSTANTYTSVQNECQITSTSRVDTSDTKANAVEQNSDSPALDGSLETLIDSDDSVIPSEDGNVELEVPVPEDADKAVQTAEDSQKLEALKNDEVECMKSSNQLKENGNSNLELDMHSNKPKACHPESLPHLTQATLDVDNNCPTGVISHPRLTKSELSSPQVRKMERENSITSASSGKLMKTVSFADEVGQSLTEVFLFRKTEEESFIPDYDDEFDAPFISILRKPIASSFGRFTRSRSKRGSVDLSMSPCQQTQMDLPDSAYPSSLSKKMVETNRYLWFLGFTQPAAQYYEFRQRIENRGVSLENITLTQPEEYVQRQQQQESSNILATSSAARLPYLSGTIKVKNDCFDKKVWLRLTTNNWATFVDCAAVYSAELSSGSSHAPSRFDTFTFRISAAEYPKETDNTDCIEFAIRYCAGPDGSWGQFWDNNEGKNYVIERRLVGSSWSSPTNSSPSLLNKMNNSFGSCSEYKPHESNSGRANTCNPYTVDYRPNFTGISSFTDYRAWEHYASESIYY
ncbi:hypothetical protein FBUS_08482 [Fasciolopsis buskii]|uniref:CBM21 domain-containing protein n=1 Tax=Fasciolopsis buskii TaxID=27845 RepID=A0A8E0RQP4_9TREM|nr:hypothetical protein FBUS_08482 [Fasciolopsis buski]